MNNEYECRYLFEENTKTTLSEFTKIICEKFGITPSQLNCFEENNHNKNCRFVGNYPYTKP